MNHLPTGMHIHVGAKLAIAFQIPGDCPSGCLSCKIVVKLIPAPLLFDLCIFKNPTQPLKEP